LGKSNLESEEASLLVYGVKLPQIIPTPQKRLHDEP
jgi:hypothetical protein